MRLEGGHGRARRVLPAQAENIVAVGRTAGRVADAAGKAAPAAAEAATALAELGRMAADVAKAGPDAERTPRRSRRRSATSRRTRARWSSLDRGVLAADGGALETSVGGFAKGCAGCASAMAAAVTELGSGGSAAARGPGALAADSCTRPLEDASKIGERFATIQRFVGATAAVGLSIRKSVPDLVATTDALTRLGRALGKDARPGLRRIEDCLNRSIDAITDAGRTYDGEVGPRVAKLSPSLLEQLADNTDRLAACYVRLQDIAGRKTKRQAPIRFDGSLAVPSGPRSSGRSRRSTSSSRHESPEPGPPC